jgi:hypothetical protein
LIDDAGTMMLASVLITISPRMSPATPFSAAVFPTRSSE